MQWSWQVGLSAGGTPQMDRKYFLNRFNHGGTETRLSVTKTHVLVLTEIRWLLPVSEGVCRELCPGSHSIHGDRASQEQDVSSPAARGTNCGTHNAPRQRVRYQRGCVQVRLLSSVCVRACWSSWWWRLSWELPVCCLQLPQSRVGGDGWDHGRHGSDQPVLQPRGPESSTNRSWTRCVSAQQHTVSPAGYIYWFIIKMPETHFELFWFFVNILLNDC